MLQLLCLYNKWRLLANNRRMELTASNILPIVFLLGGIATILILPAIELSKKTKYSKKDFYTNISTTFFAGSLLILFSLAFFMHQNYNPEVLKYLTLFGAIGGIALSLCMILFSKLRLYYATA